MKHVLLAGIMALVVTAGVMASPLAPAYVAYAHGATVSVTPFSFTAYDSCTGQWLTMQGEVRTTVDVIVNASGYHTLVHTEEHLTGIGTDGTQYIIQDHYGSNVTVQYGAVFTATTTLSARFIRQGGGDNFQFSFLVHYTRANGQLVSYVDNDSVTCAG